MPFPHNLGPDQTVGVPRSGRSTNQFDEQFPRVAKAADNAERSITQSSRPGSNRLRGIGLTDNGSPYIARDTRSFAREIGLKPLTTAIRSPESNGRAEAFVKTFKRDYVARMDRSDAQAVLRQLRAAFEHYNEVHPHSALKMLSPRMFRRQNAEPTVDGCPET